MSTTYLNPEHSDPDPYYIRPWTENFRDTYLRNREYGFRPKPGDQSRLRRELYSSIRPIARWDYDGSRGDIDDSGGIHNLEFSPDGKILTAACEKKSVMLFDPLTQKYITSIKRAHADYVNYVKFLDYRMFATSSDDTTIAIWDVRNLKDSINVLRGHNNKVKSIEYSVKDSLIVSSGSDGQIYTWNINSYSEEGRITNNPVCHFDGLMRIKLLPDSSKLVISTKRGYILLINGLDLENLGTDIQGFEPKTYRLMQLSKTTIPKAASQTHMFTRKRNRVEFIVDFHRDELSPINSSIQVHPKGWNVVSRNIAANDERFEWTCVHDIQDIFGPQEMGEPGVLNFEEPNPFGNSVYDGQMNHRISHDMMPRDINNGNIDSPLLFVLDGHSGDNPQADLLEAMMNVSGNRIRSLRYLSEERVLRVNVDSGGSASGLRGLNDSAGNQPLAEESSESLQVTIYQYSPSNARTHNLLMENSIGGENNGPHRRGALGPGEINCTYTHQVPPDHKIHKNFNRLTHYIEEANVDRGFIKEPCYSNDGRIVFSPFCHGLRILSFSENCDTPSSLIPKFPAVQLQELDTIASHENTVICTKFSPVHPLLVSGCLSGRIVWYQPII